MRHRVYRQNLFLTISILFVMLVASGCGLVERAEDDELQSVVLSGTVTWPPALRCSSDPQKDDFCMYIVAPGKGGRYVGSAGTSLATPYVSAAAGVVLASGVPASQVESTLVTSAVPLGSGKGDPQYGGGALDVAAALGDPTVGLLPVEATLARIDTLVGATSAAYGMSSQSITPSEPGIATWDPELLILQASRGQEQALQEEINKLGYEGRNVGEAWLIEDSFQPDMLLRQLQEKGLVEKATTSEWWRPFGVFSNDTYSDYQWALDYTRFPETWSKNLPLSDVTIAVVDTGIERSHEDLQGITFVDGCTLYNSAQQPLPANYSSNFDITNPDKYCWDKAAGDPVGHGTEVTGVITAVRNNNRGIAGAGAGFRIMPVRVMGYSSDGLDVRGPDETVAYGIYYAAAKGADVINLSLGGEPGAPMNPMVKAALDFAIYDKGAVVVAAAGNNYAAQLSAPANYDPVVAVGAINLWGVRASYSNYGKNLDLVAPGGGALQPKVFASSAPANGSTIDALTLVSVPRDDEFTMFLPLGSYYLYGWLDMDNSRTINLGDFWGHTGPISASKKGEVAGLSITLEEYAGPGIEVR